MFNYNLTTITVSTKLFQMEPLQEYVCNLAKMTGLADDKLLQLKILIEEVFTHIVEKNFQGRQDGSVTITLEATSACLVLRFSYLGMPFAYDFDKADDETDEISLLLIRSLSTNCWIKEDGKNGQTIELSIPLKINEEKTDSRALNPGVDENVVLRQIESDDVEKMVQCLYRVFGYSYSGEEIYHPDLMRRRLDSGLYRGFVAVTHNGDIIAHVAMLKTKATDVICESGQAFVNPEYGHRNLFARLKSMLVLEAQRLGMRGVFSHAVMGHPYTQMANLKLGCVETGILLSYIPEKYKSNIEWKGKKQRQAVITCFLPTQYCEPMSIYVPDRHRDIIQSTYRHLGIQREFLMNTNIPPSKNEKSEIDEQVRSDWNQMSLNIGKVGFDMENRLLLSMRRAMAYNIAVVYASLNLTDPQTPHIVEILEKYGFIYSGIMPYGMDGCDMLEMQYVADVNLNGDYVIASSEWAKELKEYILNLMHNVE